MIVSSSVGSIAATQPIGTFRPFVGFPFWFVGGAHNDAFALRDSLRISDSRRIGRCRAARNRCRQRGAITTSIARKRTYKSDTDQDSDPSGPRPFLPREIDGKFGDNLKKALLAFAATQGLNSKGELTGEIWQKLTATNSDPVLTKYTISNDDVGGPFVHSIPTQLEKKKDLPILAYTSPREKLAEKFHMSEELLSALNPKQKFDTANETIIVADVAKNVAPERATRVEVDK